MNAGGTHLLLRAGKEKNGCFGNNKLIIPQGYSMLVFCSKNNQEPCMASYTPSKYHRLCQL